MHHETMLHHYRRGLVLRAYDLSPIRLKDPRQKGMTISSPSIPTEMGAVASIWGLIFSAAINTSFFPIRRAGAFRRKSYVRLRERFDITKRLAKPTDPLGFSLRFSRPLAPSDNGQF